MTSSRSRALSRRRRRCCGSGSLAALLAAALVAGGATPAEAALTGPGVRLADTYSGHMAWMERAAPMDAVALTTVLPGAEHDAFCELMRAWMNEGTEAVNSTFAARFQGKVVLIELYPTADDYGCDLRHWISRERPYEALFSVLNASLLFYSDSRSPASTSMMHDGELYAGLLARLPPDVQWLGTDDASGAYAALQLLEAGAEPVVSISVDPNKWYETWTRPLVRGIYGTIGVGFVGVLGMSIVVLRSRKKVLTPSIPNFVLWTNVWSSILLAVMMLGDFGWRRASMSWLWQNMLMSHGLTGTITACDFMLVIMWQRFSARAMGAKSAPSRRREQLLGMLAFNVAGGDPLTVLVTLYEVPPRAIAYPLVATVLAFFQFTALYLLNHNVRTVLKTLSTSNADPSTVRRMAFWIRVATAGSLVSLLAVFVYSFPVYDLPTPLWYDVDVALIYGGKVFNMLAQVNYFYARGSDTMVSHRTEDMKGLKTTVVPSSMATRAHGRTEVQTDMLED